MPPLVGHRHLDQVIDGTLVVEGATRSIDLRTPAWYAYNYFQLWRAGAVVGSNVHLDGAHGDRAYRRWRTSTAFSIPMTFSGEVNEDGDPAADTSPDGLWAQLDANVDDFMTEVVADPGTLRGTRNFTFTRPGAAYSPITKPVQVLDLLPGSADGFGHYKRFTLEIIVPGAGFRP